MSTTSLLRTIASRSCAALAGLALSLTGTTTVATAEPLVPVAGSGSIGSSDTADAVASGIINDEACVPEAGRETPVILIHGTTANSSHMLDTATALHDRGYCVWAPTYGQGGNGFQSLILGAGGLTDINDSAQELDGYVDRIRAQAGTDKVDLIGHSQGGLLAHVYMQKFGGAAKVRHMVAMGGSFHGTDLNGFAHVLRPMIDLLPEFWDAVLGTSTEQQITGSALLQEMSELPETTAGVSYTALWLPSDTTVTPGDSATLEAVPGADVANVNVELACPGAPQIHHTAMPRTEHTIALTLWGLERGAGEHTPNPGEHCTL